MDTHDKTKKERESNTAPLGSQYQASAVECVCVCMCMHTHTLRKEIYEFWSPEKHVKLQGKEEGEG